MKTKTQMRPLLFWGAAAFVVLVMLVATFAALSLRNGLTRTEERLGADVVVMPRTDGKMETAVALLLHGKIPQRTASQQHHAYLSEHLPYRQTPPSPHPSLCTRLFDHIPPEPYFPSPQSSPQT